MKCLKPSKQLKVLSKDNFFLDMDGMSVYSTNMMNRTELDITSVEWMLTEILDVAESNDDVICPRSYLSDGTLCRLDELEAEGYVIFYYNKDYVGLTDKGENVVCGYR